MRRGSVGWGVVVVAALAAIAGAERVARAADDAAPAGAVAPAAAPPRVVALPELEERGPWRIAALHVEGIGALRAWLATASFATRTRPLWAFWRPYEEFVPAYFAQDIEQLHRQLEADGDYDARISSEITVLREPGPGEDPGLVEATIAVEPGAPVLVCSLSLELGETDLPAADVAEVRRKLALAPGQVFAQSDYQRAAGQIQALFEQNGHPLPEVERSARVDVPNHCAAVAYRVAAGPVADFGATAVSGLGDLPDELATREIAYREGEPYDQRLVDETVRRLRELKLFSLVRLEHGPLDPAGEVPMHLSLTPGPSHEVRVGVGYSTEDRLRGMVSWWNYNWLGRGEQIGATARVSEITRYISASIVKPHFPTLGSRSSMTFNLGQDDESTYLLQYTRGIPRLDWRIDRDTAGTAFLRSEYDSLSGVSQATQDALREYVNSGFVVSLGGSARWSHVDDVLDPRRGVALGASAEVASESYGSDFDFFRLIAWARGYYPAWGDLVLATRLTAGTIVPYGNTVEIPLWERFYAGGSGIYPVRGYGRRRVGPITSSNDPLGGRSLATGSLEARYPIYGPVLGVLFVDAGDVELSAWQMDPSRIQTGVGFGARANSPVGPIEIDLGFGLDRARGDSLVQVGFSIGPEF